MRGVLCDAREDFATKGALDIFNLSANWPRLLVIRPGMFHGFHNINATQVVFNNFFDRRYHDVTLDEWRLPFYSDGIPYKFSR